ncbi:MAG: hypothetical protein KDD28_35345, partial [Phaeodactylibacter sp.]|nr:hypothetical protein [Phaeodactylibacter sp.]
LCYLFLITKRTVQSYPFLEGSVWTIVLKKWIIVSTCNFAMLDWGMAFFFWHGIENNAIQNEIHPIFLPGAMPVQPRMQQQ